MRRSLKYSVLLGLCKLVKLQRVMVGTKYLLRLHIPLKSD